MMVSLTLRPALALVLAAVAIAAVAPASAQLNLPNALIEPKAAKKIAPGETKIDPRDPRGVSAPVGGVNPPLPGISAPISSDPSKADDTRVDVTITNARSSFAGFQVAAIVGDTAILRRTGGGAPGAGATANTPALANGQMAIAPATPSGGGGGMQNESLTVHNGEEFEYISSAGVYSARVGGGRVVVYFEPALASASAPGKKKPVRSAVFAGELSVATILPRTIVLQSKDADLKASLKVQAGTGAGGASSSPSPSAPGSAPVVGAPSGQ